jgi:asparagine synthase (glutamine-hydrolysing)
MGDFHLDLRKPTERNAALIADVLRFQPHVRAHLIQDPAYDLIVTISEDPELWSPHTRPDGSRTVAVAGRVVVDEADLERAKAAPGVGGLVCKAIDGIIERSGPSALESLGGNYVIIVTEPKSRLIHLLTDCTGVFPAFETDYAAAPVFSSHPDSLARAVSRLEDIDDVSVAEFLLTGTVSPPFTYYRRIRAVGRAIAITIQMDPEGGVAVKRRCYLPLHYRGLASDREEDLAHELATTFRRAVQLRSRRSMGRCAVALSGGLDSRAVLASLDPSADAFAFTCFDAKNLEYRSAEAIAAAAGVPFFPFHRPFEYYGDNATEGIRIAGGMGSFANNHFLGALPWMRDQGARTLLTGCYCDYLFKGLPLNRKFHPVTGHEELANFRPEFYFAHIWPDSPLAQQVRDRVLARYPERVKSDTSDESVFDLEVIRTFPLCYEGDNTQRLVPQRLTGWFPPVSDPALMRLICRIPYRWKLNRSIFKKAVRQICGQRFDSIPDANTGAPVSASPWSIAAHNALLYAKRQLRRLRPGLATDGSWPNWRYYAAHSQTLRELWSHPAPAAEGLFRTALGSSFPGSTFGKGTESEMWLQIQVLTLRTWWTHRT